MKLTREGKTRPLISLTSYSTGSGDAPSGHVIVSTGSNGGTAWGSNVSHIYANGSNHVLGPFVNFAAGSNITLAVSSNTLTITSTGGGSGSSLTVQDEGTPLATDATTLNFVGAGVAATGAGATKTITISGGSGSVATDAIWDATGDLAVGTGADTAARLAIGADGRLLASTGTTAAWEAQYASIVAVIDGGGSVITTGVKGDVRVPFACVIERASLLADVSGSIVVDIWVDTYANYPPTVADTITASAKPTISTATKAEDTTLTGWTTTLAEGSTIRYNVDSITTCTRVTVELRVRRT